MMMHAHPLAVGEVRTRDWIAVMAMQGLLGNSAYIMGAGITSAEYQKALAELCYKIADSMIEASGKDIPVT